MPDISGVKIQSSIIPLSKARSGKKLNEFLGITFHETGNYRKTATAKSHGVYLNSAGKNSSVSAHYYVDEQGAVQCIPEYEVAWHAGDGTAAKGGNMCTVAIEICTNWGYLPQEYAGIQADVKNETSATPAEILEAQQAFKSAVENAAKLAASVLHRHGQDSVVGKLFMHYHHTAKDCPHNIRKNIPISWHTLCEKVQFYLDALAQKPEVIDAADKELLVLCDNFEYFPKADIASPLGKLEKNKRHQLLSISKLAHKTEGFAAAHWCTLLHGGGFVWALALAERCVIVEKEQPEQAGAERLQRENAVLQSRINAIKAILLDA